MLEEILGRAVEELRSREGARDEVLPRARRARMLSKQAILLIHNSSYVEAGERLEQVRALLGEMGPHLGEHPELEFYEEVEAAREEYAEASILHGLKAEGAFPEPEEVGVPVMSYVLGLGDVPGELRREALDALRRGDLEAAEGELGLMEEIYLNLVSAEEASLLLRGLRRKLDIARRVVENTRGDVTAEAGRRRLGDAVKRLSEKLEDA